MVEEPRVGIGPDPEEDIRVLGVPAGRLLWLMPLLSGPILLAGLLLTMGAFSAIPVVAILTIGLWWLVGMEQWRGLVAWLSWYGRRVSKRNGVDQPNALGVVALGVEPPALAYTDKRALWQRWTEALRRTLRRGGTVQVIVWVEPDWDPTSDEQHRRQALRSPFGHDQALARWAYHREIGLSHGRRVSHLIRLVGSDMEAEQAQDVLHRLGSAMAGAGTWHRPPDSDPLHRMVDWPGWLHQVAPDAPSLRAMWLGQEADSVGDVGVDQLETDATQDERPDQPTPLRTTHEPVESDPTELPEWDIPSRPVVPAIAAPPPSFTFPTVTVMEPHPATVAIWSPTSAGATTITSELAAALVRLGKRVALLDLDPVPTLARRQGIFDVPRLGAWTDTWPGVSYRACQTPTEVDVRGYAASRPTDSVLLLHLPRNGPETGMGLGLAETLVLVSDADPSQTVPRKAAQEWRRVGRRVLPVVNRWVSAPGLALLNAVEVFGESPTAVFSYDPMVLAAAAAGRPVANDSPQMAEAADQLAEAIVVAGVPTSASVISRKQQVIVVASAHAGAGASTLAGAVATISAEQGLAVAVMDLDPRGGLSNRLGVSANSSEWVWTHNPRALFKASQNGLLVTPVAPKNLSSRVWANVLRAARDLADVVVVDVGAIWQPGVLRALMLAADAVWVVLTAEGWADLDRWMDQADAADFVPFERLTVVVRGKLDYVPLHIQAVRQLPNDPELLGLVAGDGPGWQAVRSMIPS